MDKLEELRVMQQADHKEVWNQVLRVRRQWDQFELLCSKRMEMMESQDLGVIKEAYLCAFTIRRARTWTQPWAGECCSSIARQTQTGLEAFVHVRCAKLACVPDLETSHSRSIYVKLAR